MTRPSNCQLGICAAKCFEGRVNAVAPGVVETEMSSFTKTDAGREVTLSMQALKRSSASHSRMTSEGSSSFSHLSRRDGLRAPQFMLTVGRSSEQELARE
jgi:NAD(P)-dependent dehydrogenase (short-subunit alcohol dehydrogenase family)